MVKLQTIIIKCTYCDSTILTSVFKEGKFKINLNNLKCPKCWEKL